MTKIVITLEDDEPYEWLQGLINRSLANPNSRAAEAAYENIVIWKEALENAEITREPKPRKPRAPRTKKPKRVKLDKSGLVCNDHPKYGGEKRIPSTDCDGCWGVYGKFHPLEVKQKRIAFRRRRQNA